MDRKSVVMGLDVSTSCTGYSLIEVDTLDIVTVNHIDFKDCTNIWEKADVFRRTMTSVLMTCDTDFSVDNVFIESPLKSFRPGMSNAQTITTLISFNGICSYVSRVTFDVDPEFIACTSARKLCGISVKRESVCGVSTKDQVLKWAVDGDFKDMSLPMTKTGKYKPFVYDEIDSYVIAKAGALIVREKKMYDVRTSV